MSSIVSRRARRVRRPGGRPIACAFARSRRGFVALQIRHELPIHAVEGGRCSEEDAGVEKNGRRSELPVEPRAKPETEEDRDRELKPDAGESRGDAAFAPLPALLG